MVVGGGRELHQDFSHDTYPRLLLVRDGQLVEVVDDAPADLVVFAEADAAAQEFLAVAVPFSVFFVCRSLYRFVGAHAVQAFHEDVSEHDRINQLDQQFGRDLEAGLWIKAVEIEGDHGHVTKPGFLQSAPDKSDVIGRAAAPAGLRHDQRHLVRVIAAACQRFHELSHRDEGRIAGVIVDVFEPRVYGAAVVIAQDLEIVAFRVESSLQQPEMDRRHLR